MEGAAFDKIATNIGQAISRRAGLQAAVASLVIPGAGDALTRRRGTSKAHRTRLRTEACITTLSEVFVAAEPWPDDGAGNENTNGPRSKAYDWLLADTDLTTLAVPVRVGARTFPAGLVFDSRVYQPLADVAPIQFGDSDALNMQHMPIVRDFAFPK